MSSSSERTPNTTGALLPIDDRLVAVSESAESSRSASVSEQRVEPESRAVGPSEDEATQCRSLLLDAELGTWGARFLVSSEICTPTPSDRACYPPRGYQCIYQDTLEAGLRIPPY